MRIAIMGAGLSGLACAITLEKHGIYPTIFEDRRQVGDRFVNGETTMSILNRPINDPVAYLSKVHSIYLSPVGNIRKLILHSQNEMAEISGNLGFSNIRGRDSDSYEKQLEYQIRSKIIFNSKYTYEELLLNFTHVVLATGDGAYAAKVQDYQEDITVTLKGATVQGKFDLYTTMAWLDSRFAPKGYGYLIPLSEKEASISIAYPDYPENQDVNPEYLWDEFYSRVCRDLDQSLIITDRFQVTRYIIGICGYPRIGNTFFVGNCFGSIMPLFGFGQIVAILTGIYAALDLCGLGDYSKLTIPLRRSYNDSIVLRRAIEQLDNSRLDMVVRNLGKGLGERLFNVKSYSPLRLASHLLRPLVINKKRDV